MIKILIKFTLMLLPVLLLSTLLAALAWHTGEALPIDDVVRIQHADPTIIYGTSKLENIMPLKLEAYAIRQPDILILGSSRLLQMRDKFFTRQPQAVYNASGGGWQLGTLIQYYQQLDPDDRPKIILLGLDQIWFNADSETNLEVRQLPDTSYDWDTVRTASVAVMQSLLSGDLTINQLLKLTDAVYQRPVLGLTALENSFGYRADGSLQQGLLIASREMQNTNLASHITGFQTTTAYNYASGTDVQIDTLDHLDEFLTQLKADGITVVGLTVPYHYDIYDRMQASGEYTYIDKAVPIIEAMFDQYGFTYYYFGDMRQWGAGYDEWYDGWHITESNSLRMLLAIFQSQQGLFAPYTDINAVQNILDTFTNPMDVMGELPE